MTITLSRIQQVLGPSPTGSLKVYGWESEIETFTFRHSKDCPLCEFKCVIEASGYEERPYQ